jgi:hypothetical protein
VFPAFAGTSPSNNYNNGLKPASLVQKHLLPERYIAVKRIAAESFRLYVAVETLKINEMMKNIRTVTT